MIVLVLVLVFVAVAVEVVGLAPVIAAGYKYNFILYTYRKVPRLPVPIKRTPESS
jgi:hypothetical protein